MATKEAEMATTLTRRRPFEGFAGLESRLDRLFEDAVGEGKRGDWPTAIDLIRGKDKLILRAEMPGITPDDVKIQVRDDIITVSGQHEETKEEKDENYVCRERRFGSFSRSIALPSGVDASKIDATSKDGVVEVTIPLPAEKKATSVEIKPKAG
jgi:HSP20 family protein